jgi:hypothetical protein
MLNGGLLIDCCSNNQFFVPFTSTRFFVCEGNSHPPFIFWFKKAFQHAGFHGIGEGMKSQGLCFDCRTSGGMTDELDFDVLSLRICFFFFVDFINGYYRVYSHCQGGLPSLFRRKFVIFSNSSFLPDSISSFLFFCKSSELIT